MPTMDGGAQPSQNGPENMLQTGFGLTTARYRMVEPDRDFYRDTVQKILPYCGNEFRSTDYHSAIETLNDDLNLRLDDIERKALGLMMTGLAQAYRFDGDLHIPLELGENSAVHSCHTAVLMNEMFRRAGLLEEDAQTNEVATMRIESTMACLVHDMGEILGELNSLSQRAINTSLAEDADLEKSIYVAALRLAFSSVIDGRPDRFYQGIQEMRDQAGIIDRGAKQFHTVDQVLDEHQVEIPREARAYVDLQTALFDLAELKDEAMTSREKLFRGYAVKAVEHMQGTRHFTRFAMKDGSYNREDVFHYAGTETGVQAPQSQETDPRYDLSIPSSIAPSFRQRGGFRYTESGLGELFELAETPAEKALASTIRDGVYQTTIEWLQAMPELFDREAKEVDSIITKIIGDLAKDNISHEIKREKVGFARELLNREQTDKAKRFAAQSQEVNAEQASSELLPVETRDRLIAVYKAAIENNYQPRPGEVLALSEGPLPEALRTNL